MFRHKYAVFGAGCLLAATVACSNTNPVSPNAALTGSGAAGPNGETLKIVAPAPIAPVGGARPEGGVVLVVANVSGQYASFPVTYRYEIRNEAGATVVTGTQAAAAGATTSIPVSGALAYDSDHSWRVRAEYNGAFGPWSAYAAFKTPAGSYINGNEVLDVLSDGKTIGQAVGGVTFLPGVGAQMDGSGYIAYQLPQNLQEGEFSFMATNVDEGNPGDKSKVMSMGEICHDDVTDNDYRMTVEVRGRDYATSPGMISYRIITGIPDNHRDTQRVPMTWTRSDWHFFKMWWRNGVGGYEIRRGGPAGALIDASSVGTDGRPYRPVPHCVYVGAPPTRAGVVNQTHSGQIVKNVWVSGRTRPVFPTAAQRP